MAFKRGDFTSGNAFLWQDIDLSAYAGNDSGLTPYSILLTDAAGKTARGFIGAVGAGETLSGTELITTPGFEATFTDGLCANWLDDGSASRSEELTTKHSGAKAQRLSANVGGGVHQPVYCINQRLNKFSGWVYPVAGSAQLWATFIPSNASSGTGSWQNLGGYFNTAATTYWYLRPYAATNPSDIIWDDLSMRRVLDPPATGVHIVSAYGGSTRAWTTIESGFNPNTITSAVVSVNPQILGGGSMKLGLGLGLS